VTVAAQYAIEKTIFPPRPLTTGPIPSSTPRRFLDLDLSEDRAFYWFAFAVLLVVLAGAHRLSRSRLGRAMVAVGHDPVVAAVAGVNPARVRVAAFAISGALAGLAGVLFTVLFRIE